MRRRSHRSYVLPLASVTALAIVVLLTGCRAKEAPSAGYVSKDVMYHDASIPFHKAWVKPGLDKSKYAKIYIAPVDTKYMLKNTDWQNGERKDQIETDVAKLAVYAQRSLQKAFREDPDKRMLVLDAPSNSPDTVVLEVALIEVVPSKVVLNALGYAPFFIGTTITAVRAVAEDQSTAAFEARFRDAATGEIIAMAADREAEQRSVVTMRGLTWYSHAEFMLDSWSQQILALVKRKPSETVEDTETFTLLPW